MDSMEAIIFGTGMVFGMVAKSRALGKKKKKEGQSLALFIGT